MINKLGFPNYFLIVWDFVRFAREQGIQATARGSGVGSLVSYALHLSHVCPLEYDLLFERFLDESRARGAGYRHRLLPAAPRRGDPVRQGQVRHGERGADRHVRHAGRPGGDPRRGPRAGAAHPAGRRRGGHGARGAGHHAAARPWRRATS